MLIRLLAIVAFAFVPLTALADDSAAPTDTPPPAADSPTAPAGSQAASTPQTGSMLGPSTLGSGSGSGGSTGDSATLQPAGVSPLQSTTSDSTGLTAPNGSALQAPATSDQALKVIADDADGAPVQVADASTGPSVGAWLAMSVLFAFIVTILGLFYPRLAKAFAPIKKLRRPRGPKKNRPAKK